MKYHIEEIDKIREFEEITTKKTGKAVFDISHWNSGNNYKNYLYQYLDFPTINSFFDYIYSYEISTDIHLKIRNKFNIKNPEYRSILVPSSTLAIVNIINFLKNKNLKKICILQPSYFSVAPCMHSFGINFNIEELGYQNHNFLIPLNRILEKRYDAVWLTSPVFCTNQYYLKSEIEKLNYLLNKKTFLICDESLAPLGSELSPHLETSKFLFSIYSPHKVLGTNAVKFSCIITHKTYQDFFDISTDIYSGGMTLSSYVAIMHFLSDNYEFSLLKGTNYIKKTYIEVVKLLGLHQKYFSYTITSGIYVTIFFKHVPYKQSMNPCFIKDLIENTNVSLLPGYLEGYYEKFGFCFRINLTLDRRPLLLALNKVILFLENKYL